MREHDPEMLDHILKGQRGDNSEYIKAMTAGKNQYEKDKQLEQLKQPQPPSKDRER
jgi:hypothetical protein